MKRLIALAAVAVLIGLALLARPTGATVVTCGEWSVDASIGCEKWEEEYLPQLEGHRIYQGMSDGTSQEVR